MIKKMPYLCIVWLSLTAACSISLRILKRKTIHQYRILIVAQNNNNLLHRNGCYPLLGAGDFKTKQND